MSTSDSDSEPDSQLPTSTFSSPQSQERKTEDKELPKLFDQLKLSTTGSPGATGSLLSTHGTRGATPKSEGGLSSVPKEEDSPSSRDTPRLPGTPCKQKPPRQSPSQTSRDSQSTPTRPKTRKTTRSTPGTLGATPKSEGGLSSVPKEEDSPSSRDTPRLPGTPCKQKPPRQSPSQKSGDSQSTPTRPKTRKTSRRTPDPVLREHSPPLSPPEHLEATPESAIKEKDTYYYYAFQLPFVCSDPNYQIIKVGMTRSPGRRLYDISTAFDKQISKDEFKCNFGIIYNDSAATTISKAKEDGSKILFICKVSQKDDDELLVKLGEGSLRGLLSLPIVDDFVFRYLNSIPNPAKMKIHGGPTEWSVCTEATVQRVRKAFTSNELKGNTGGDDDCWDSWVSLINKLKEILPDTPTATCGVTFGCQDESLREDITFR